MLEKNESKNRTVFLAIKDNHTWETKKMVFLIVMGSDRYISADGNPDRTMPIFTVEKQSRNQDRSNSKEFLHFLHNYDRRIKVTCFYSEWSR